MQPNVVIAPTEGDKFKTMSALTIARLLDKNELEGRDFSNCLYRAIILLKRQDAILKKHGLKP